MRSTQQTAAPAPSTNATREQVREQVRQSIQDANQAARDAVQGARDAQQAARDASQAARDAGNGFPVIPPVPPVPPFGGFTIQNVGHEGFGGIPPQVVDISIAFFVTCAVMVIGWPISRAFGKRIERRGGAAAAAVDAGTAEQLQRIEQAVDAMAIEIERISESLRFMARLQSVGADSAARGVKLTS